MKPDHIFSSILGTVAILCGAVVGQWVAQCYGTPEPQSTLIGGIIAFVIWFIADERL